MIQKCILYIFTVFVPKSHNPNIILGTLLWKTTYSWNKYMKNGQVINAQFPSYTCMIHSQTAFSFPNTLIFLIWEHDFCKKYPSLGTCKTHSSSHFWKICKIWEHYAMKNRKHPIIWEHLAEKHTFSRPIWEHLYVKQLNYA